MQQVQSNVCIANYELSNENVKFQINEQSQTNGKTNLTLKLNIQLQEECLITHIILKCYDVNIIKTFRLASFEAIETLDDPQNQTYNRLITCKEILNHDLKIQGLGISKKLRITFSFVEQVEKEQQKNQENKSCEMKFKNKFQNIQIFGYQLYVTPAANQMVTLLNISHIFKKNQKELNGAESDILLGLSLLSSRRYIQAAEIFKKVATYFAEKGELLNKRESYFHRASSLQILVADSINQPSMLTEKLQAMKQAVLYQNHIFHQDFDQLQQYSLFTLHNPDQYECILRLSVDLIKIITKVLLLETNFDALRMANLRCLEFIIEQIGCGLGGQLIQILKLIIKIAQKDQSLPIMEMVHKVVNVILQELEQGTLKLIQTIWFQIVVNGLFDSTTESQKLIMKICECLISAEQAHFKIDTMFLKQLNLLEEDKIWTLTIQQIIPKQNEKKLAKITNWINNQLIETLNFTNFNQLPSKQQNQIIKLLQLIHQIVRIQREDQQIPFFEEQMNQQLCNNLKIKHLYYRPNSQIINLKPILIKLLEQSVNGKIVFPCFQLVWNIMIEIQLELGEYDQIYELIFPFLNNIFTICKVISPQQDVLILLLHILLTIQTQCPQIITKLDELIYSYMETFCQRVPHSIYDETFKIFDLLLSFSYQQLDCTLIEKCTMALVDQYTVKGQAQKISKSNLIKLLIQDQSNLFSLISVCLIKNEEPILFVQQNKVKDNKQIIQEYEIFQEKLQLACELFQELSSQFKIIVNLIQNSLDLRQMLSNLLQSHNSKVRFKIYQILQSMVEGFLLSDQTYKQKQDDQLIFLEFITSILSEALQQKNDTKCLLNAIVILNSSFTVKFQKQDNPRILKTIINMWSIITDLVDTPHNGIYNLIFELLNIWSQIINKIPNTSQLEIFIDSIFQWSQEQLELQEPWHQYNILKVCGYLFGLDKGKNFRKFPNIRTEFWESVFTLQNHQNRQLQLMAIVIIQLCAQESLSIKLIQQNAEQQIQLKQKILKQREQINKYSDQLIHSLLMKQPSKENLQQSETIGSIDDAEFNQEEFLWMKKIDSEQLQFYLQNLFTYQPQQESKIKQSDIVEKELSIKHANTNTKNILDDDPLDFEELGIIEVDDEEWNEYDDLRKIPILKDKLKSGSPQVHNQNNVNQKMNNNNKITQQQDRILSGNRYNNETNNVERKPQADDQVLKTLRPHNQVFRPLTPPIGQQNHQQYNEIQSDMQLFSDFVLQNPQEFKKIMEEIKNTNAMQSEQQDEQKQSKQQQQQQQQQKRTTQDIKSYDDQSNQQVLLDNNRRKVDELEFDPQFSNSSQDEISESDQLKSISSQNKQQSKFFTKKKKSNKLLKRVSSDTEKLFLKKEHRQSSLSKSQQQKPQSNSDDKSKNKKLKGKKQS